MKRYAALLIILGVLTAACSLLKSAEPKISIEQQAQWLQARAELAEAKVAVTAAEGKLNTIVQQMQATCPLMLKDGPGGLKVPDCAPPAPKPPKAK